MFGLFIIEYLAFKNANSQMGDQARSAPIEEWIQNTINTESHNHDDAQIAEVISKNLKKN